ncbi:MAG: alpha-(1-_3)-arabinofuranosyltransferase family protein [Actinomycetota bacterium]
MNRRADRAVTAILAAVSYLPILLSSPGRVSADTKTYLTIDPARLLSGAWSMWDPSVGAGTVPHQNIGYLFPLGPYYWLAERLAAPDWLAQRIVWGTLVFAAAYGTYRLCRWLRWEPTTALVAALAYGFSPYLLSYLARLSIILFPWAALPWLILLVALAARTKRWWPAAAFALVVVTVGSVNATALLLAGLGPVIWLFTDLATRRVRWPAALSAAAKIGGLSLVVSVWWIVALRVQSAFGLPILEYTETYQTVGAASTPTELLRGLGYWFFYGGDRLDPWVGPSTTYIDHPLIIALGLVIAAVSLLGLITAFAGRIHALTLLLFGLVVSVGAAPLGDSSIYGALFETFATETTAGLALRSTPRAAPLVILALAMGLGSASRWRPTASTVARAPALGRATAGLPVAIVVALTIQMFPWFSGSATSESILRDETLPEHVTDLATWLDTTGDGRVYELPGADFGNYRWGGTVDPVLPGLIDRPYLARELVPQGGAGTADLLGAIERRLSDGWLDTAALPTLAALFAVETIVARNDLEHERYRLARPGPLWTDLTTALGAPEYAGPITTDTPEIPLLDELTFARSDAAAEFPVVAAFDVGEASRVRVTDATAPTIVAGNAEALVDLAALGVLDIDYPVLYAATLHELALEDRLDASMLGNSPWWVVSDTNRKEGRRWSTIGSNLGALETTGDLVLDDDPRDARLELFAVDDGQQTIAAHRGDIADVRASYYGSPVVYTGEDAPWFAIDGDPSTAWRAGVFEAPDGLVWEVDLRDPATTDQLTLLQPVTGATNRFITSVRITLDPDTPAATSLQVPLEDTSRRLPGQNITLPRGDYEALRIEILADNLGDPGSYVGQPGIGFAEVTIPGADGDPLVDDRVVVVPDLADNDAWDATADLSYVFTRQRIDPATPNRTAPETRLVREFVVPDDRRFELLGQVRLDADADDQTLSRALGEDPVAIADRRLPGVPASRAAAAIDGDPNTAWRTPFDGATGAELRLDASGTADALTITWLDDGQHSVPTALTVEGTNGIVVRADLGAGERGGDGTVTSTVVLPDVQGPWVLRFDSVIDVTTPNYFSNAAQALPLGIVDVSLGGVELAAPTAPETVLDDVCRDDLLVLDGEPLPVRIIGTVGEALSRDPLDIAACETVDLSEGVHRLDATAGSGFDVDRVFLTDGSERPAPEITEASITADNPTSARVEVDASTVPVWLVLTESWNEGWTAQLDGEDLGTPVLIDGFANGWLLPPGTATRVVELEWTPQRTITLALWFSLLAGVGVIALLIASRRRARHERVTFADHPSPARTPRTRSAGIVGLAVLTLLVAGFAGAVVVLAVALSRLRWLAMAVVVGAMAVVAVGVTADQLLNSYPPGPDWPSRFAWTTPFAWSAVAAAVASPLSSATSRDQ